MILVDRYVYDVTRRLPERQRKEVARELQADILEMIDDKAGSKKPTQKQVIDVLMQLGRPSKLADSYRDHPRYIIGPEYYESYTGLLKTALVVIVPIVMFLNLMTQLMVTRDSSIDMVINVIGSGLEMTVHLFFWITVTAIVVSKVALGDPLKDSEVWTPEDLPLMPPEQTITRTESYMGIAWSLLAIVATLAQIPAIHAMINGTVPLFFADEFWPLWILGLLAVSFLALFAEIAKMIVGGWTKFTTIMITLVNAATVGFFVCAYYFVKPIVNPELIQLIERTLNVTDIAPSFDVGVAVFVWIVAAISIWEITEAWVKYKKGGKHE